MKGQLTPASVDQIVVLKRQFAQLDDLMPYKLTTGNGPSRRFTSEEAAITAYHSQSGKALLTYNQPGREQKVLKYKYH